METAELRYMELKNQICRQIYKGIFRNGEKIPSERQLSEDYKVSRITVRKALELLEAEGLILREVGNGTIVTLNNYGNETLPDVIALAAPSRNPFFARFIAEFQQCVWEHDALLLYVEAPENTSLEDCLYRLYTKNIRSAVVWPDDRGVDQEKLLRLRSIGMNLVFFDTDAAGPYADSVFVDNEDAVETLLKKEGRGYGQYLYVGWDNLAIANIRKREEAFLRLCPQGQVIHVPWQRNRQMDAASREEIRRLAKDLTDALILCGTGELAGQTAEVIWDREQKKTGGEQKIRLASIDEFEGAQRCPAAVYSQDLETAACEIYRCLERQSTEKSGWKAGVVPVKGRYHRNGERKIQGKEQS